MGQARVDDLARRLAAHQPFRNAVALAEVDGVPIATVLTERSELMAAARLARLYVANEHAGGEAAPAPPED